MNKKLSMIAFATVLSVFTFSALPAHACPGAMKCAKHAEKKMEKKCKKGCTKPCCAKKKSGKCSKSKQMTMTPDHSKNSRYND